jgi:hypothetical protein
MVKSQRMAGCALFPIGRDDRDLSEWLGCFNEASQPISEDPVVVRAEQSQR